MSYIDDPTVVQVSLVIMLFTQLYFIMFEVVEMMLNGCNYFNDYVNLFDVVCIICFIMLNFRIRWSDPAFMAVGDVSEIPFKHPHNFVDLKMEKSI